MVNTLKKLVVTAR